MRKPDSQLRGKLAPLAALCVLSAAVLAWGQSAPDLDDTALAKLQNALGEPTLHAAQPVPAAAERSTAEHATQVRREAPTIGQRSAQAGGLCPPDAVGNCCEPHPTPGCNNDACCEVVCNQDAFCCNVEWDAFCVGTAEQLCDPLVCDFCPLTTCGDSSCLSQTAESNDTGGAVACGVSGGGTTENGFARCFNLAANGCEPFLVDSVTFGVEQFDVFETPDVTTSVDVNLYTVASCGSSIALASATPIGGGTASVILGAESEGVRVGVDFGGLAVPAGVSLLVEVRNDQDGTDVPTFAFRPFTNQSTVPGDDDYCNDSYIRAEDCGIGDWITLSSIGFPTSQYVIDISGHPAGGAPVVCGDGQITGCEECDDNNTEPGDGCSELCFIEACGNGVLDLGEQCDDGNLEDCDGCSAACELEPFCGDGVVNSNPACDLDEECDGFAGPCPGFCASDCTCPDIPCLDFPPPPEAPVNDCCADAIPASDGLTPFDTTGATTDGFGHTQCLADALGQTVQDIWYSYTASCTGELKVTTCVQEGGDADYDTDIVVYSGCDAASCSPTGDAVLGCNDDDPNNPCGSFDGASCTTDDDCPDGQSCVDLDGDTVPDTCFPVWASTVFVPVVQGQCYTIRVGGFGTPTDFGTGVLNIECVGAAGAPLISEVVDGTLPGGQPKYAEISNCTDAEINLADYSIGNFNNGGTDLGGGASTMLMGVLAPGESYIVAYENAPSDVPCTIDDDCGNNQPCDNGTCISVFEALYGFPPDQFIGPFVNGDDVIALFFGQATGDGSDAVLVDLLGVIGVDGTGEVWEYTDSYARRLPDAGPSAVFNAAEWDLPGPNFFEEGCAGDDTCEAQRIVANTSPGTHQCTQVGPVVPTVSEWGLIIMTLLLLTAGTIVFGRAARPKLA